MRAGAIVRHAGGWGILLGCRGGRCLVAPVFRGTRPRRRGDVVVDAPGLRGAVAAAGVPLEVPRHEIGAEYAEARNTAAVLSAARHAAESRAIEGRCRVLE